MQDWVIHSRSFGQPWGQRPYEAVFGVPAYQRQITHSPVFLRRGLGAPRESAGVFSIQDAIVLALVAAGFGGAIVWAVSPKDSRQERSLYGAGLTGGLAAVWTGAMFTTKGRIGQGAALLGLGALASLAAWNAAHD